MKRSARTSVLLLLLLILLAATLIRIWGIEWGLPYLYHPDEPNKIQSAQQMIKNANWDPEYYRKPSLFIYLNGMLYYPYYWIGKLGGHYQSLADIQDVSTLTLAVGYAPDPGVVLMGRYLTLLFGVGIVLMCFLIGKSISGSPWVGLLAAGFAGLSPTLSALSRFITPDSQVTFLLLVCWYFCWRIYRQGRWWDYILAGIFCGLTLSTKYNGGLIVIMIPIAHWFRIRKLNLRSTLLSGQIWLSAVFVLAAFLLTTPIALFRTQEWWSGMLGEFSHYNTGHIGAEGNSPLWYLTYLGTYETLISLLAIPFLLSIFKTRDRDHLFLVLFPAAYTIFICFFTVHNDRTILPAIPFLMIMAALFIHAMMKWNASRATPGRLLPVLVIAMTVLGMLTLAAETASRSIRLSRPDARELARVWLDGNLPPHAKVALEAYSPYLDPGQYDILGLNQIVLHPLDWYRENGFEYLIFSSGMYERFYAEPDRYGAEIDAYNNFFNSPDVLRIFRQNDFEVRVLRVTP